MQFLANENFPMPSIIMLRENNHNVISVCEEYSGITDEEVIRLAQEKQLIILTFDSDYREIIIRHGLPNPPDVVYFRFKGNDSSFAGRRILSLLESNTTVLLNRFTVLEENNIRQRKY